MSLTLAKRRVGERCVEAMKEVVEPKKELSVYDQVELAKSICHLDARLNASGESEAAVTAKKKIESKKFRKPGAYHYARKGRFIAIE